MESKYYLNDFGLITLIKSLSKAIKEKYYNRTEIDVLLEVLEERNIKLLLCAEDLLVVLGKVDLKEYSIFFIKAPIEHSSSISSLVYRFEEIEVTKPLYINGIPSPQVVNAWAVGDVLMIIYLNNTFYALNLSSSSDVIKDIRLSDNKLLYTKDNSTWINFVNIDSSVTSGSPNLITGGAVATRIEDLEEALQADIQTVSDALDSEVLRANSVENNLRAYTNLATTTFLVQPMLESGTYVWQMSGSAPSPDILSNGLTFNIVVPEIKTNVLFWNGFHYNLQQGGVNLPVSTLNVGDVLKLRFTGTLYWQGAFEVVNLSNKATREDLADAEERISDVEQLIPESATSQNQLADKNFVNSSIATNTATFRGTAPAGLTEALFIEWALALLHDNNDYVFWPTADSEGNVIYKRYKYSEGPGWVFEYDLNNSSFTQEQWETINSGTNSNWKSDVDLLLEQAPTFASKTDVLNLSSALLQEVSRATTSEQALQTSINNEATTRQQAIETLDGKISANTEAITTEKTRAESAEQNLDSKIGVNTAAIATEKTRAESVEQTLQLAISTINGKIPAQATSQNQLADKEFVNSSVSTATADFKGTYYSLEALEQVIANANDYAFVIANDAAGNTVYKRYKWAGTGWVWEYDLNNSSFTQAQWAAIQSGITAALVTKLSDLPDNSTLNQRITQAIATALLNYYTKSEIDAALGNKQDVIQDLAAIRSGASAGATAVQPETLNSALSDTISESGVYDVTANNDNAKFASLSALLNSENLDTLIPLTKRRGGMSIKFVQSSDNKYTQARCMAQNFTTDVTQWQVVDDEPTAGSDNLVKSGGVKNSLNQVEQRLTPLDGQFDIDFVQGGFTTNTSSTPKTCVETDSSYWIRSDYQDVTTIKKNTVSVNSGYSFRSYYFDENKVYLGLQNNSYNPTAYSAGIKYVRFAINKSEGITPQDNHGFTFESNIKSVNQKITELEESVQQDFQELSNAVETVTTNVNNVITPKVTKNETDVASLGVRVNDYDGGTFDFNWEQGAYTGSDYKTKSPSNGRIRTSTYLDWKRLKSFSVGTGFTFTCYFYDENYNYLSNRGNNINPTSYTALTVYVTISVIRYDPGITPETDFGLQYELNPAGFKKEFYAFKDNYELYNDGQNSIVKFSQRNTTSLISNYIPHNVIYDVSVNSGYKIYVNLYNSDLSVSRTEIELTYPNNIKYWSFAFCKFIIKKADSSAITLEDNHGFAFKTFLDYVNEIHDRNIIEDTKYQHGIIQACCDAPIDGTLKYGSRFNVIYMADLHGRFRPVDDAGKFKNFFSSYNLQIFNAGDIVSGTPKVNGVVSPEISEYMAKAITNCVYHCMGQHEVGFAYSYSNVKAQCLTHEETFNLFIAPIKDTWGLPNLDTIYYYKDFETQKIRLISLYQYNAPIIDHPTDNTKYKYPRGIVWHGDEQLTWLCNTLNSVPEDYGVIIMMHQNEKSIENTYHTSFFNDYDGNTVGNSNCIASESPIYDIVDAYIKRQSLQKTYTAANQSQYPISDGFTESVNVDFSNAKGEFLNYVTGDTHIDSIGTIGTFGHPNLGLTASGTSTDVVMRAINYGYRTMSAGQNASSTLLTFVGYCFDRRIIRIGRIGQQFASTGQIRMMTAIPFYENQ